MAAADNTHRESVFLSYRRDDSPFATGRIYDRLVDKFGKEAVFRDVDSMPLSVDFRVHIVETIRKCDALLAVIGPLWLTVKNKTGKRRLDAPTDYVRMEIESALRLGVPVVPLFIDSAPVNEKQLPESLQELAYCHGLPIRRDPDFRADVDNLISRLQEFFAASRSARTESADKGKLNYPNGNQYVGAVKNGHPHGHGTMIYASGAKYIGEWKEGKKHGWGLLSGKGAKYAGEWKNGEKVGLRCVTYSNGTKYAGEWKDRSFHGLGILTWTTGEKYVGEWKGGRKQGKGIFSWPDGSSYEGDWVRNEFDGFGTFLYADGSSYVGQWKRGKKHGQGIHRDKKGRITQIGQWENGEYVGK